jgi:thioester reductase-like protein
VPGGRVLLTGATGFLGMELLVRLLERTDREVVLLVRAADDAAADRRVAGVLDVLLAPGAARDAAASRVTAVAADLETGLDLGPQDLDGVDRVVHCAASVSFALPLEEARRINVDGTRRVLELAAALPDLDRVVHVSTAYVAGERRGVCREDEGDLGQAHRNTYEASKLEAEGLVAASGLPHCTLRPAIVVGDSTTGWTPAFNVIYWPLQAFARGLFARVPADPGAVLDVVPVDHVAEALHELTCGPRRSGTFHAVAGEHAVTAGELAELAAGAFGRDVPAFVPRGEAPEVEAVADAFLPYFWSQTRFDASRGQELVAAPAPPVPAYFDVLMAHARAARWGKRAIPRWAAARADSAVAA